MTDRKGGRTIMVTSARECAKQLEEAGANAVGANCDSGKLLPTQMAHIIAEMETRKKLPRLAEPNAGLPIRRENKTAYDMPPELFAEGVYECYQAGARLIGGCCGTTPAHIQAVTDLFREKLKG
jgi:5-methyltetrahydrofolate--homocysteine methyltransferase